MSGLATKRSFEQMQKIILERYDWFAYNFSDPLLALPLPEPVPAQVIKRSRTTASSSQKADATEAEAAKIKEVEVDIVCEDIYERMEEQAMIEMLGGLEAELAEQYTVGHSSPTLVRPACSSLLWDVVATPTMMQGFAAAVTSRSLPLPVI